MGNRVCVLTGGTSGIGRAAAFALARGGWRLALVCRSAARGEETAAEIEANTGNGDAELVLADLSQQAEIHRAAAEIRERYPAIHLLLNNAGVVHTRFQTTADGLESTLAINHLAYFLLTELLRERLVASAPARIVSVASDAHRFARLELDDLEFRRRGYRGMRVYGTSKLLNILWNRELARRLEGTGVTANCAHPGGVNTRLGDDNGRLLALFGGLVKRFLRTPEKGAETPVWLATASELEGTTGGYFADCRPRRPSDAALDDETGRRLWAISERMCGLTTGA